MAEQFDGRREFAKWFRKAGTVTATAAALLGQTSANARESDPLKGLLDQIVIPQSSLRTEKPLPPPLVLSPADDASDRLGSVTLIRPIIVAVLQLRTASRLGSVTLDAG